MIEKLVSELRKEVEKRANTFHYDKGVGITALLFCPLKWEYRWKYPHIKTHRAEIDNGVMFELKMKDILRSIYGDRFTEEKEIVYSVGGLTIQGHIDAYVEEDDKVIAIEFKHTKFTRVLDLGAGISLENLDIVILPKTPITLDIPQHYTTQAKIQRFLLERITTKRIVHLLILHTTLKADKKTKEAYVEVPITESIDEDELIRLVKQFREVKEPRFPWECRYCAYTEVCERSPW